MDTTQISLIKESWRKILPIKQKAGELFYQNLFNAAPELRPMFKEDIKVQASKLMSILGVVVGKLDRLHEIMDDIRKLSIRHNDYGVQPAHYEAVGSSLLLTLEQGLGSDWTPDLKTAWTTAYTALASVMIQAQTGQA